MATRASRVLVLTGAILSLAVTIGAPAFDGLPRAVAKLFTATPSESAWTFAPEFVDFFEQGGTADAVSPTKLSFQVPTETPVPSRPLGFQSVATDTPLTIQPPVERAAPRGALVTSLYVSFIGLQALDAHSTIRALDRGARETNPMIAPLADNTAALIALKAGTAAGVIYMTDRVRRHNRLASIIIMAAANSAYATIVARNYRIAASQPPR